MNFDLPEELQMLKDNLRKFVDNELLSRDTFEFRNHLKTITPDIDLTTTIELVDGTDLEVTVPVTVTFFWPDSGV